jgi:transposase
MDYVGIDLHMRESQICTLTPAGETRQQRVRTTGAGLTRVFAGRERCCVLIEAATESEWVATLLEELGHAVVVADPNYAPMYPDGHRRRRKSDPRDAAALALAARQGTYRAVHRASAAARLQRTAVNVRHQLVRMRTAAIAQVRAAVRGAGLRVPGGAAETFVGRVAGVAIPPALRAVLAPLLTTIGQLTTAIAGCERDLRAAAAADPVVRRARTVPGVGPLTALMFRHVVEAPTRFTASDQVASYLGVVPREVSSGDRIRRGRITRAGCPRLRWLLVQSAWGLWRSRRAAARPLQQWAQRLAHRRGRRIAIVALARRLATILWAMWRREQRFDPALTAARA